MSSFDTLSNYIIPNHLLMKICDVYKLIGSISHLLDELGENAAYYEERSMERNVYQMLSLAKPNVSEDRMRLLITKGALPKTEEEKKIIFVKNALKQIIDVTTTKKNSSKILSVTNITTDILDFLKKTTEKNVRFNDALTQTSLKEKKTIRKALDEVIQEYDKCMFLSTYEPITLSALCLLEIYNLNPYSDHNDIALLYYLYYFLLRSNLSIIKYTPFLEYLIEDKEQFFHELAKASVNYKIGVLYYSDFLDYLFKMIEFSFKQVTELINNRKYENQQLKSEKIERGIMEVVPSIFTKKDILDIFPEVSSATVMRVLTKLRDKKYILPLGTGRNAKWKRLVEKGDLKYILGVDVEDENENQQ